SFSFKLSGGFAGFDTPATFRQFNRALAARVAVYRGNFNDALTALQASFLDAGGDLNLGVFHIYSTAAGDEISPVFEISSATFVKLHAHQSFEADAEAGDLRFSSKTFKRVPADIFDSLTSDLAAVLAETNVSPYPIIRNEELILLRAEANVGAGNFAAAEADMNIVRAAAGLAAYPAGSTTASNGLDRVLHEKRYSLFGEGHRWIDMRRYGRLGQLPIDRPGDTVLTRMVVPLAEFSGG
ncbi:MAG: RagB/SusD family nutrient uptake outer membrane protein, partial [bacterium]